MSVYALSELTRSSPAYYALLLLRSELLSFQNEDQKRLNKQLNQDLSNRFVTCIMHYILKSDCGKLNSVIRMQDKRFSIILLPQSATFI